MARVAAWDEVMTIEDMEPQRREQGPRRQGLGRWGTGALTDADDTAVQQGEGGGSETEAPTGWDGGEENGDSAGDQRGRGEGAMGRRSGWRSEGADGTGEGSATQEVPWATACRTMLSPDGEA